MKLKIQKIKKFLILRRELPDLEKILLTLLKHCQMIG
jgi:hypothetical protein